MHLPEGETLQTWDRRPEVQPGLCPAWCQHPGASSGSARKGSGKHKHCRHETKDKRCAETKCDLLKILVNPLLLQHTAVEKENSLRESVKTFNSCPKIYGGGWNESTFGAVQGQHSVDVSRCSNWTNCTITCSYQRKKDTDALLWIFNYSLLGSFDIFVPHFHQTLVHTRCKLHSANENSLLP